jgi:hypothetical protein
MERQPAEIGVQHDEQAGRHESEQDDQADAELFGAFVHSEAVRSQESGVASERGIYVPAKK